MKWGMLRMAVVIKNCKSWGNGGRDLVVPDDAIVENCETSDGSHVRGGVISKEECLNQGLTDYEIINQGKAIKLPCGAVSHNENDVKHRFCARCGRFLEWKHQKE